MSELLQVLEECLSLELESVVADITCVLTRPLNEGVVVLSDSEELDGGDLCTALRNVVGLDGFPGDHIVLVRESKEALLLLLSTLPLDLPNSTDFEWALVILNCDGGHWAHVLCREGEVSYCLPHVLNVVWENLFLLKEY